MVSCINELIGGIIGELVSRQRVPVILSLNQNHRRAYDRKRGGQLAERRTFFNAMDKNDKGKPQRLDEWWHGRYPTNPQDASLEEKRNKFDWGTQKLFYRFAVAYHVKQKEPVVV